MTSGELFLKSNNYQLATIGTSIATGTLFALPGILSLKEKDSESKAACYWGACLTGILTIIFETKSIILYRKGARKLHNEQINRKYITLAPSTEGLGAKITF